MTQDNDNPSAVDMPSTRLTLEGAHGNQLVAAGWGNEHDPPVILLHGGGQTRHSWQQTANTVANRGWWAIALDQRGHGESEWVESSLYEVDHYAADIEAVSRRLPRRPVLVGASLGGIAAVMAVGGCDDEIAAALTVVDVVPNVEQVGVERIVDFMLAHGEGFASLDEAAGAVAAYLDHRTAKVDTSGLAKNLRLHEDGRYHWHWDPRILQVQLGPAFHDRSLLEEVLLANGRRFLETARRITVPTLLIRGAMSDVVSLEGAQEFLEAVPHARFVDIVEAGHMVAGDRNDAFTEAVVDFLDSVDGRR